MELSSKIEGTKASISIVGKLSVTTAPELETLVNDVPEDVANFDLDLAGLEYISSAGLRVLVSTQKLAARRGGGMVLLNPSDDVMEILEMTGLSEVMEIQR